MSDSPGYSTDYIRRRYDRLAAIYPIFDWLLWLPRGICNEAVRRMSLVPGGHVLEIGCGAGRNFAAILGAIGSEGHLYGVDLSEGMLARARALCERSGWHNVELMRCEASEYSLPERADAVLFSLSYSVILNHDAALRHAWMQLRPGGCVVVLDGKRHRGTLGKLLGPIGVLLSEATVLGNPNKRPWEDLRAFTGDVVIEEFGGGSYYLCVARKAVG